MYLQQQDSQLMNIITTLVVVMLSIIAVSKFVRFRFMQSYCVLDLIILVHVL